MSLLVKVSVTVVFAGTAMKDRSNFRFSAEIRTSDGPG
jgi:hypothetical protein